MRITLQGMNEQNETSFCFEFDVAGDPQTIQRQAMEAVRSFNYLLPDADPTQNHLYWSGK